MNSWMRYLQQFNQEFNQVKNTHLDDRLPVGEYSAQVINACLKESKKGEPMVELTFKVLEGKYQNWREWKYHLLREGRMKYLKWDLKACGLSLEHATELPSRLREVVDKAVTLKVELKTVQGKEYRNLYVNKVKIMNSELLDDSLINKGKMVDEDFPF